MIHKTIKLFDAEVMPPKIGEALTDILDNGSTGNGTTYIEWQVEMYGPDDEDTRRLKVDAWLIEQGAEKNEKIMIKCWR